MKLISKILLSLFVLFVIFTVTGCSKKQYPKAEYHLLTGRKAQPYTSQGFKTVENTLSLGKKKRYTLSPTDSVMVYPLNNNEKVYSNYKEFFANVIPGKNYKVSLHSLPDTHKSTYKYLFMPLAIVTDKQNEKLKLTAIENEWTNAFEKPGLKRAFTFNSGETDQVAILIYANNVELDKMIHMFMINFITYKFMTAPTGDFFITIEEIKEK